MNPLVGATLTVRDAEATARLYAQWLDHHVVERGWVPPDLAEAWGAPACAGAACIVMAPASGAPSHIRLVEAPVHPGFRPLRSFGWAALEIAVQDVAATHERLRHSPFEIIGPPREIVSLPVIHPMQVQGPDGEVLYLTQILQGGPGSGLTTARSPIDALFIGVAGCSDFRASARWFGKCAGMHVDPEIEMPYRTMSRAFDLPADSLHRLTTARASGEICIEFDQLPPQAMPRERHPGALPAGVALCTLWHPSIDKLRGDWITPPTARNGLAYAGRRAGTMRAPDDLLVEWVECTPAEAEA